MCVLTEKGTKLSGVLILVSVQDLCLPVPLQACPYFYYTGTEIETGACNIVDAMDSLVDLLETTELLLRD